MMNVSVTVPPLAVVAAALRKTTETLAREVAVPTSEPPQWTEFEWRIARAAAAMHGVSSLLCAGLRWEGPDSWNRFLAEQRDQSAGRYLQIVGLLDSIDSQARRRGVPLVALKGAALYENGLYIGGERPMGDIDLLIRSDDAAATESLLEACDYTASFSIRRHLVFQPRTRKNLKGGRLGEHIDNPIKIEVHTRISEHLPVVETDITEILFPRMAHSGLNAYPSATSLMMHLLLHAAGNMRAHALRFIQLHDIARLAVRLKFTDWEDLLAVRIKGDASWWSYAPLMLVERYYPATIPRAVLDGLGAEAPWLLGRFARSQRLTDVSWSNIQIQAFPGVEWSRTPREALGFMRGRIWPSHEARMELQEGANQIPDSSTVPWYGLSHGNRILRWIFSRPPRVQTLLSVRAALAQNDRPL